MKRDAGPGGPGAMAWITAWVTVVSLAVSLATHALGAFDAFVLFPRIYVDVPTSGKTAIAPVVAPTAVPQQPSAGDSGAARPGISGTAQAAALTFLGTLAFTALLWAVSERAIRRREERLDRLSKRYKAFDARSSSLPFGNGLPEPGNGGSNPLRG